MADTHDSLTYQDSGVDVHGADQFVDDIQEAVQATHKFADVVKKTAYAGMVRMPKVGDNPLIAATCDGVGTKLLVAQQVGVFKGLGQDLVAMNVNDLLPAGAKPLFFLDYIATGKLEQAQLSEIVTGIAEACAKAECALVGGETAEMPGLYKPGDFDLAGFAVGTVDENRVPVSTDMVEGDIIFGLPSSGVHSNGLSLARKALFDHGGFRHDTVPEGWDKSLGLELLTPTELYVKPVLSLLEKVEIRGAAHITGGGLLGRVDKLIPPHLGATLKPNKLPPPRIFNAIQVAGNIRAEEMASTFNMGIGFVAIVSLETAATVRNEFTNWTEIGQVTSKTNGVDVGYGKRNRP
ncbi:MAG: phosphoribosylformylglycinamidine cyclo-ligase [Myxococcota bacterium]|nr:phosphoribosylformylglycinamidine cyclo-ligase [Myxococcota bacterium]